MRTRSARFSFSALSIALVSLASACSDDDPSGPEDGEVRTLTVDASAGWGFARFAGEDALPVTVTDPASANDWTIGFYRIATMLNGGASGPGAVSGHCLCENEAASDGEVMDMTDESELAAFEAVTSADIPADEETWTSDVLSLAISDWYSYNPVTHVVSAAPEKVWYVRTASGSAFAKLHFTGIASPTQAHAGRVTIEFALQPASGAPFQPAQSVEANLANGAVYLDLETGAAVSASAGWDISLSGYEVRVNGGASGNGQAAALRASLSFAEITSASAVPPQAYATGVDSFGGVFVQHPWYRYNLTGTDHQIWPTYDVFLVREGDAVYKVQVTSYYGPAAASGHITFRYAQLQ